MPEVKVGQRFGKLVVVECVGQRGSSWICKCDCGGEVTTLSTRLVNKRHTSCGCGRVLRKDRTNREILLSRYKSMKGRCLYPVSRNYHNYGGRGIKVCARWLGSFELFCKDMGPPPTPDHQLDRIDCDGDYKPSNCKWATRKEQNRNRRNNRWITHEGETLTLREWTIRLGIPEGSLHARLKAMPVAEAFDYTPSSRASPNTDPISYNGRTQSVGAWSQELGIRRSTLNERRRRGLPVEEILSTNGLRKKLDGSAWEV